MPRDLTEQQFLAALKRHKFSVHSRNIMGFRYFTDDTAPTPRSMYSEIVDSKTLKTRRRETLAKLMQERAKRSRKSH